MFRLKQLLKQVLQGAILPCVYRFWRVIYFRSPMDQIVLADAHHDSLPYSMENVYALLLSRGYEVTLDICNYKNMSAFKSFLRAMRFMRTYAQCRYVFICDNFLPVVSCKKSDRTTVVQLWHSCGLLKKMGYDTTEDIPRGYRGNVYRNYDLVTVSAPSCVEVFANAMHLKTDVVKPLGVSRTDNYFDPAWGRKCVDDFYQRYPELRHKKLILWAPTFRGNAGDPYQIGTDTIDRLERRLGPDYHIIRKVHPYVDNQYHLSNCDIQTERLLPVIDLLISDYSSVVCEFMTFQKPYILYAPDWEEYSQKRGVYVEYTQLSPYVAFDLEGLCGCVLRAANDSAGWVAEKRDYHLQSCDGHTTARILDYVGLKEVSVNV